MLRGPQGTLYGLNTEGWTGETHTKNPMDYQGTDLILGWRLGHFYRNAELVALPEAQQRVAFSLSAFYNGAGMVSRIPPGRATTTT